MTHFKSTVFQGVMWCSSVQVHWYSSEMLVKFYQKTRYHIPEDGNLHRHCCENVRSNLEICMLRHKVLTNLIFRRELGYENAPKWHICCSVDENVNIIFHSIFPMWTVRLEFWINEVLSFAGINDNFKFKINPFVLSFSLKKMVPLFGCMFSW